jgi:hypothetical protein
MPRADLAYTYRTLGQPEQARRCLHECLADASRIGSFRLAIHSLPALALLEADHGNLGRSSCMPWPAITRTSPIRNGSRTSLGRRSPAWQHPCHLKLLLRRRRAAVISIFGGRSIKVLKG